MSGDFHLEEAAIRPTTEEERELFESFYWKEAQRLEDWNGEQCKET